MRRECPELWLDPESGRIMGWQVCAAGAQRRRTIPTRFRCARWPEPCLLEARVAASARRQGAGAAEEAEEVASCEEDDPRCALVRAERWYEGSEAGGASRERTLRQG